MVNFYSNPIVMDTTDEFDSAEAQKEKHKSGAVQALEK